MVKNKKNQSLDDLNLKQFGVNEMKVLDKRHTDAGILGLFCIKWVGFMDGDPTNDRITFNWGGC